MHGGPLAIFGPLPPPMTGMEAFTQTLLAELGRAGTGATHRWTHVDTSISRSISEREKLRAAKVVRLLPQVVRSVRLAARGFRPYYPISQNRTGLVRDLALLVPFRLARRPIVVHLNGGILDEVLAREPRVLSSLLRWLLDDPESSGIVVTSSLRHCLMPLLPPERIAVVHNTAAVPSWVAEKHPDRTLRVLFIGTLIEAKGYRELVEAVAALVRDGVDVELDVAGEPYAPEDEAWIARAPREGIRFRGLLDGDAKWRALQSADVVAVPTRQPEGQPLSMLEGMGAACAIVATRRPGIVDSLAEDEAVLLDMRHGSELQADLERALRTLAEDRPRVAALGRAARARFERDFRPDRFLQRWLAAVGAG